MGTETPAAIVAPPPTSPPQSPKPRIEIRVAALVLGLLPGLLVLYFGFNGGGFFPGTVGFACVIVIQLMMLRVLLADHPFEGVSRGVVVVGGALAAFATWVLLSGLWSDAEDRALIEFDRALLYLLVFLLFGFAARSASRIPWIVRGLAAAVVICSGFGLFSRLRPDVLHTTSDIAVNRLAYPLTYWNALGILAAIGILLLLGLAASRTEPRPVRALACGAVPVLAVTLYFTFSRGAILALALGLVLFALLGRSRGLLGTVLATAPTTLWALVEAYHRDELASSTPKTSVAVTQGDQVLKVVIVAALLTVLIRAVTVAFLDRRLGAIELTPWHRRAGWLAVGSGAVCAVLVFLSLGGAGWLSDQYDGFVHGAAPTKGTDLRTRLTDPSSNGRIEHWRAALEEFGAQSLHGGGAGTYEFAWYKRRDSLNTVIDGHGLYVEVMGELGLVGLLLLAFVIAGILVALARRISGPNRVLYAAVFAAVVTWAVHAGVDWDWEMPAVTAWVFAAGGTALAARSGQLGPASPAAQRSGVPIALGLAVAAATPALLLFSQARLQESVDAFNHGDCDTAAKRAYDSIDDLALRPEPYRILGYCDIRRGRGEAAVTAMRRAVDKSPRNWESHFGLALAMATAGKDPRGEIGRARDLNPREPLVRDAVVLLAPNDPDTWRRVGPSQLRAALGTGRLTLR